MARVPAYLFVYGTLKRQFQNPFSSMLQQEAQFVAEGYLTGQLFDLGSYPGILLTENPAERVYGEVFQLGHNFARVLSTLDLYEGYNPFQHQKSEYTRCMVSVRLPDLHADISAWAYVYNASIQHARRIHTGRYPG